MAPAGLLGPTKGHFGSFWGHFGAQVLTKLTNVPYNAQMEAFGQFVCYAGCILDSFWSFGSFWRPYGEFGALFGPFGDHLGLSWWQSSTYQGMLALFGAFWTLFRLLRVPLFDFSSDLKI